MQKQLLVLLCVLLIFTGCGKKDSPAEIPLDHIENDEESRNSEIDKENEEKNETTRNIEKIGTIEEDITGKAISPLTGIYINEADAKRRPLAVMINNYKKALPQSGLGQASIYYETLAEGGITRILALFQEFDATKIGPVRSARHYFIDFAYDNDAIYVHHGWSPQAKTDIQNLRYPNLDGMSLEGTAFWRDSVRVKQAGMYEHSSYTNAENLLAAWDKKGYRKEVDSEPLFTFLEGDSTPITGQTAEKVRIPYSGEQISEFTYDNSTKLYKRSQTPSGGAQIDELTGEQLTVKNIIVQFTTIYVIKGDSEGRREVKTVGSGEGILVTNGMAIPIKWSKASRSSKTIFKDEQGNPLKINKGKTWICVYGTGNKVEIE